MKPARPTRRWIVAVLQAPAVLSEVGCSTRSAPAGMRRELLVVLGEDAEAKRKRRPVDLADLVRQGPLPADLPDAPRSLLAGVYVDEHDPAGPAAPALSDGQQVVLVGDTFRVEQFADRSALLVLLPRGQRLLLDDGTRLRAYEKLLRDSGPQLDARPPLPIDTFPLFRDITAEVVLSSAAFGQVPGALLAEAHRRREAGLAVDSLSAAARELIKREETGFAARRRSLGEARVRLKLTNEGRQQLKELAAASGDGVDARPLTQPATQTETRLLP